MDEPCDADGDEGEKRRHEGGEDADAGPEKRAHDGNDVADDRNRAGSALGYVQ